MRKRVVGKGKEVQNFAEMRRIPRMTIQRRLVLEVLRREGRPLSAKEIHSSIRGKLPRLSLETVYRTLNLFVAQGMAAAIYIPGGPTRYVHVPGGRCRPYFVCLRCGTLEPLPRDLAPSAGALSSFRRKGMEVTGYSYVIYGICRHCRGGEEG